MIRSRNNKGESYIDICIGVIVLIAALVLTINIYSFFTLKQDLDEISTQLIETATYNGCFGDEFNERVESLKAELFDFNVSTSASNFYNAAYKKVQLGNKMTVSVSVHTKVRGVGIVDIPITCTSTKSGLSEKYWKG